ncbi:hypothetical protein AURDEDRAFT_182436 [Auricularia subglabra TFB-10046 SS5]|nr:hypothetical protein AURDEDRAFT_182436 [Auricularia subglabra TFB-10046 SS5]
MLKPLPAELELVVVEEAARMFLDSTQRWVASLCLVCRAFKAAVDPILYELVIISASNLPSVRYTANRSSLFCRTRRLVVLPQACATERWDEDDADNSLPLAPFKSVRHFSGLLPHLAQMETARLQVLSLAFTEPWDRYVLRTRHTAHITHLHIASIYDSWDEWSLTNCAALTHVAFDLAPPQRAPHAFDERTLEHLCYYLRAERLHRLLFRTRHFAQHDVAHVRAKLHAFATEHKLGCIWLDEDTGGADDGAVTLRDDFLAADGPLAHPLFLHKRDTLAIRDALMGKDLFLAGTQMYTGQ